MNRKDRRMMAALERSKKPKAPIQLQGWQRGAALGALPGSGGTSRPRMGPYGRKK